MTFNPDQARDEQGRWTDMQTGEEGSTPGRFVKGMSVSKDEADTLVRYAVSSSAWNNHLRGKGIHAKDPGANKARLDAMLARAPKLESDLTVYRMAPQQNIRVNRSGFISDKAFMSTTSSREVAVSTFFDYNQRAKNVLLKITVPAGTRVLRLNSRRMGEYAGTEDEHEVILPRGSKLKMMGVDRSKGPYLTYMARYVKR